MRRLKQILLIISLGLLLIIAAACTASATTEQEEGGPTGTPLPNTATPLPMEAPDLQIPDISVHTPEDVQQYFAQWADDYKLALAEDVLAIFTFPHPTVRWVGGAVIYHVPSVSTVTLDFAGNVDPGFADYKSDEAQARLEAVLADPAVLNQLQTRVQEIWGGGVLTPSETAVPTDPAAPAGLIVVEWVLVSYGPASDPVAALPGTKVTAVFDAAGQVGGSTGCNSYSASYQIDGSQLTIGNVAQTLMACAEETIMAQEAAYTAALGAAQTITIEGDTLIIAYKGGELRFTSGA